MSTGKYAAKVQATRAVIRGAKHFEHREQGFQMSIPVLNGKPEEIRIDTQPGYELVILERVETIDNVAGPLPALTVQIRRAS